MIYKKQSTTSTNDDARSTELHHMDVVWAEWQSAGRGQRGHSWHSVENENLTFSVVLEPRFLPIVEQFLLSEVVALALVATMKEWGIECRIKWTNDIYVGDKKAVGILIEHSYSGGKLSRTIVGIGINVNQREFSADIPNPVSLALLTDKNYDREALLKQFEKCLSCRYSQLQNGEWGKLQTDYHSALYRRDEKHTYALADGTRFEGVIRGVKPTGDLIVEWEDGKQRSYLFKEIEFVL